MKKDQWKAALRDTLPVLAGYVVLGMGFGIIMTAKGYEIWWSLVMSLFIYAGSMQYAGINLLTAGAPLLTVALTTLAVNARHLFYGISMIDRYKGTGGAKPYLIFALTDETYSLVCTGEHTKTYYVLVSLLDQCYWVAGTLLGALLGSALTFDSTGIDFALTALFLVIFTDQWMKNKDKYPAIVGIAVSVVSLLIFGRDSFLIPAMIGITAALFVKMFIDARREKRVQVAGNTPAAPEGDTSREDPTHRGEGDA